MIAFTITKRPYVLAFLISYLVIAWQVAGLRWTLLFLIAGYLIAFISEYLSINYGIPYGWYFYKYENLQGELLLQGVPVWDSISYVFMCFAGLYVATFLLRKQKVPLTATPLKVILISACFVTLLDVIIDPVAHMGKRWFLGEIYYYPNPGYYFDITFANFMGWFLTSFTINSVGVMNLNFLEKVKIDTVKSLQAIGLYYGIFGFGLVVAIYLNEWKLVVADLVWLGLSVGVLTGLNKFKKNSASSNE